MNAVIVDNRAVLFEGSKGFGSINLSDFLRLNEEEIAKVIDLRIEAATREKGLDSSS